jgi:predicted HAD superfamily Cof-like phosphohydrolase
MTHRVYKCHDYSELRAFLEAMLGSRPIGVDPENSEISAPKAPELQAHLRAVLGDNYTHTWLLTCNAKNYTPEARGAQKRGREALADYLRSVANMLDDKKERTVFSDVRDFNAAMGVEKLDRPGWPEYQIIERRLKWIEEEIAEIREGIVMWDLTKVIDGYLDIIYFAAGAQVDYGVHFGTPWEFVHGANMEKVDPVTGKVTRNAVGKVQKPAGWVPPDQRIREWLRLMGYDHERHVLNLAVVEPAPEPEALPDPQAPPLRGSEDIPF